MADSQAAPETTTARPVAPLPEGTCPPGTTAALVLDDGTIFWGQGAGAKGVAIGEVCFNTSITGYQEIMTDPSYAGQIITFTFPHIGNVGTNPEDVETTTPAVRGCILQAEITDPANWRATRHLNDWLEGNNLVAITGVDTRRLTRRIRDGGAPIGAIIHDPSQKIDTHALQTMAASWPGLEGMDLAKEVTCAQTYSWDEATWVLGEGYGLQQDPKYHVVAMDFGAKRNILRCLAAAGCRVTVVPASTSADDILAHEPDGVFLSNGPGDPAATGEYTVPVIQKLLASGKPMFGICLGHQMLALALGATTHKMHMGHRGGNQPVQDLETGKVEITSQNHGFVVDRESLPDGVIETHKSLFDGTVEGIRVEGKPVFSVQYHPEASPGPQDSHYLFKRFIGLIAESR
ncbi:glutamine-hydrolyzing carbamoyl-phosphate synthase small subunit [Magnetospira sp. QH-2]|uniref:glutamine-hydrolyzing carbamoyl-phosphate synthase small subunit n=1 Tax=Magnetospira sp. (strain QH-2) TaxID=1288970 RepID=UPI0003E81888|nr:glutamine-hydrolyzing carbamoyl-phosphate synthase small subunit [Magnetospira sp. QH-2]CCQ72451.1 carbamoyl-phosphate synthase (glutamine-hydrolysing) [Magnetospira sp. QH-2]